jgi:hypothetical protein
MPLPSSATFQSHTVESEKPSEFDRALAEAQAKYPDAEVEAYTYSGGRLILRTPDEGAFAKFMDERAKPVQAAGALCRRCVLWPALDTMEALFRRKPGLPQRIADKLLDKAGAGEEIELAK